MMYADIRDLITSIIHDENDYNRYRGDKLKEYCLNDKNLKTLINLIYSNIIDKNTLEYYMKIGILKFLKEHHIIFKNEDDTTVHTNIIDELLDFIDSFILTSDTNPDEGHYGVNIIIKDDTIEFVTMFFKNNEEMVKKGYHNDSQYYIDSLRRYAVNCMYKSQNS